MKKVLIIGKGLDIVKTFYYVFKNNQVTNISFRSVWNNPEQLEYFDIIVLSGFHFEICRYSKKDLINYTKKYNKLIQNIKKKCKTLYLVSTDLSVKRSISKVVFFYYTLLVNLDEKEKIRILSFHTINGHEEKIIKKLKNLILHILNIKTMNFKMMASKIEESNKIELNTIKFYFLNISRTRGMDRYIRLIFDLFLFKLFRLN